MLQDSALTQTLEDIARFVWQRIYCQQQYQGESQQQQQQQQQQQTQRQQQQQHQHQQHHHHHPSSSSGSGSSHHVCLGDGPWSGPSYLHPAERVAGGSSPAEDRAVFLEELNVRPPRTIAAVSCVAAAVSYGRKLRAAAAQLWADSSTAGAAGATTRVLIASPTGPAAAAAAAAAAVAAATTTTAAAAAAAAALPGSPACGASSSAPSAAVPAASPLIRPSTTSSSSSSSSSSSGGGGGSKSSATSAAASAGGAAGGATLLRRTKRSELIFGRVLPSHSTDCVARFYVLVAKACVYQAMKWAQREIASLREQAFDVKAHKHMQFEEARAHHILASLYHASGQRALEHAHAHDGGLGGSPGGSPHGARAAAKAAAAAAAAAADSVVVFDEARRLYELAYKKLKEGRFSGWRAQLEELDITSVSCRLRTCSALYTGRGGRVAAAAAAEERQFAGAAA